MFYNREKVYLSDVLNLKAKHFYDTFYRFLMFLSYSKLIMPYYEVLH